MLDRQERRVLRSQRQADRFSRAGVGARLGRFTTKTVCPFACKKRERPKPLMPTRIVILGSYDSPTSPDYQHHGLFGLTPGGRGRLQIKSTAFMVCLVRRSTPSFEEYMHRSFEAVPDHDFAKRAFGWLRTGLLNRSSMQSIRARFPRRDRGDCASFKPLPPEPLPARPYPSKVIRYPKVTGAI